MKTELWVIGKTAQVYLKEGIQQYEKRIKAFIPFDFKEINPPSSKSPEQQIITESNAVLKQITQKDYLVLLDSTGKEFSSQEFAKELQKIYTRSQQRLIFFIGGAYGISDEIYKRADLKVSLSKMTFTHDMCRVIFLEQLYRALTIINNHPYQH